jgi:hypothetical protein
MHHIYHPCARWNHFGKEEVELQGEKGECAGMWWNTTSDAHATTLRAMTP